VIGAMLLGSLSYGASIVLFIRAMRQLGTARTSALFSTAPLAGVILSLVMFQETPNWLFFAALPLMLVGTLLLVNEKHQHVHFHNPELHNHQHRHDDGHHDHLHQGEDFPPMIHSHPHQHQPMAHDHEHLPDIHHRHSHEKESME
jgi:ABC-type nickel/cobalt efflux system permease component RcnA